MKEQVQLALTKENSAGLFYLPHHAVKQERRGKNKWTIIYDASFSEGNSPSWNDVFEIGPNLLLEVLATLLSFHG